MENLHSTTKRIKHCLQHTLEYMDDEGPMAGLLAENYAGDMVSMAAVCSDQDLISTVFRYLDIKDLCSASCVCHFWNLVGSSEDFWKEISFRNKVVTPSQVLDMSGLTCGLSNARLMRRLALGLRQLHALQFCHVGASDQTLSSGVLEVISDSLPSLKTLVLEGVTMQIELANAGVLEHDGLESLSLLGCDLASITLRCGRLLRLALTGSQIQRLPSLSGCPALVELDACACRKLQDSSIRQHLSSMTGLKVLRLGSGVLVSDDTARELASVLTGLTSLSLADTAGLSLSGVRDLTSLVQLDLSGCESITSATLQPALDTCLALQSIRLDSCHMLTSLKLTMPVLQDVSLRGCVSLQDIELHCWRLKHLGLGAVTAGGAGNLSLTRLALHSDAMMALEAVQCSKLLELDLHCPILTELTVRDCDNLSPAALEALGDKAPAPSPHPALLASNSSCPDKELVAFASRGAAAPDLTQSPTAWQPDSLRDLGGRAQRGHDWRAPTQLPPPPPAAAAGPWRLDDDADYTDTSDDGDDFNAAGGREGLLAPSARLMAGWCPRLIGHSSRGAAAAGGSSASLTAAAGPAEEQQRSATADVAELGPGAAGPVAVSLLPGQGQRPVLRPNSKPAGGRQRSGVPVEEAGAAARSPWQAGGCGSGCSAELQSHGERFPQQLTHDSGAGAGMAAGAAAAPMMALTHAASADEVSPSASNAPQAAPFTAAAAVVPDAGAAAAVAAATCVTSMLQLQESPDLRVGLLDSGLDLDDGPVDMLVDHQPAAAAAVNLLPAAAVNLVRGGGANLGQQQQQQRQSRRAADGSRSWARGPQPSCVQPGSPEADGLQDGQDSLMEVSQAGPVRAAAPERGAAPGASAEQQQMGTAGGSSRGNFGSSWRRASHAAAPAGPEPSPAAGCEGAGNGLGKNQQTAAAATSSGRGSDSNMQSSSGCGSSRFWTRNLSSFIGGKWHAAAAAQAALVEALPLLRSRQQQQQQVDEHSPQRGRQQQPGAAAMASCGRHVQEAEHTPAAVGAQLAHRRCSRQQPRRPSMLRHAMLRPAAEAPDGGGHGSDSDSDDDDDGGPAQGRALAGWEADDLQDLDMDPAAGNAGATGPGGPAGSAQPAAAAALPLLHLQAAPGRAGLSGAGGSGGRAGVPRLKVLRVEGCDNLKQLGLAHSALQQLSVSGCRSLLSLSLAAPGLQRLELEEVGDLALVSLQQVGLTSLTLGGCRSLAGLELSSGSLSRLDLRGCGQVQQLLLDCPRLQIMDATFCSGLSDAGLATAVAGAPPLTQLVLSVCCQVGGSGLSCLSCLPTLQTLDLSYTEVCTLQPVFTSCPQLRSLSLSSCRNLQPKALQPLLDKHKPALPLLTSLDTSYCDLAEVLVAQLISSCSRLEHLALNGCSGVTCELWQQAEKEQLQLLKNSATTGDIGLPSAPVAVATAATTSDEVVRLHDRTSEAQQRQQRFGEAFICNSRLQTLNLVRCSHLKSLCLGMLPASGAVEVLQSKHYLLEADRAAMHARQASYRWVVMDSAVPALTSLRAGLSGVQVVALALPKLIHLDLNACKHLRVLELRCPLLLTLHLQACRSLLLSSTVDAVMSCPQLEKLDIQHLLPKAAPNSCNDGIAAERLDGPSNGSKDHHTESFALESGSACHSWAAEGCGKPVLKPANPTARARDAGTSHDVQSSSTTALLNRLTTTHASLQQVLRCAAACSVCASKV